MKAKLLALIETGREKEESELAPHVDDSGPSREGAWTAKDHLAHLAAWRLTNVAELDAIRSGAEFPALPGDTEANAKIYADNHPLPATSVLETARRSWDATRAAVESASEEVLLKPRLRQPDEVVWKGIAGSTYHHLGEHLEYSAAERGDEAGAEAAARWSYDLVRATSDEVYLNAGAAYNFGCFFAKRARAAEAVPHLREGIELRPELREWAKQDTDLDPIRSNPELASLLG